ncbi:MAG: BPSS1780 family membrane protein [Rubrivivax sp.]
MALMLKPVEPSQGVRWVTDAFRLFMRRPLSFLALLAIYVVAFVLFAQLPLVGLLVMFSLPLLSLGFMVAGRSALLDGPVRFSQYIEPLRTDAARRRALVMLCTLYGLCMLATVWLANAVSGDAIGRMQALIGSGTTEQGLIEAMQADGGVRTATFTMSLVGGLVSIPFWHAAPLVHWGGQGVWQSLFSSTLALWRARGAFALYGLVWVALAALPLPMVVLLLAVLLSAFGMPGMTMVVVMLVWAVFISVFYLSVLFTFNDSFGLPPGPVSGPSPESIEP